MKRHYRIGLVNIKHLKNRISWSMGVAGIIRLLTWETQNTIGISKTKFQKRLVKDVYNLSKNGYTLIDIEKVISNSIKKEILAANAIEIYQDPVKDSLISPIEAQRRLRYFSEEFLNKEFDIFLSLLPDKILTDYFANHFSISDKSQWTIFGSSNDFEQSSEISFMYMDTLAYSHNTSTLIAIELKMDSQIGNDQLLKYVFMSAFLEEKGMIAPNTKLEILILSPDSKLSEKIPNYLLNLENQLNEKLYPKKRISFEEIEKLVPRCRYVLKSINVKHSTWQSFGEYFETLLSEVPNVGYSESLYKLIEGFLKTLQTKFSRKQKKHIYVPAKNM